MRKKILSVLLAVIILLTSAMPSLAFANGVSQINNGTELRSAFTTGGSYKLANKCFLPSFGITKGVNIDGAGFTVFSTASGRDASLYQNTYAITKFSNIIIEGVEKPDVGIWLGSGEMSFTNSEIRNFKITDGRYSAIGMVGETKLTLNNTTFTNNKDADIIAYDASTININAGTSLDNVRLGSRFVKVNIGSNWNGSFNLTLDYPVSKVIGNVGNGADVSKIHVTNAGYYADNIDGKLVIKKTSETAIHFDMSQRDVLYKGSTGFLYGESEINVPSIDLLQGLKPDTMVQKAVGGLQHPTGDAVRTGSALLSAGVRDMQIYLQDNYLEWPYDAPMKNGTIDLDEYQKTVEKIVYKMICDSATKDEKGAFLGIDGKYYKVNASVAEKYSFVLFNEPDQIWFDGKLAELEKSWKQIYNAVHKIYPNARCVGPNFSGFNADSYDKFLAFCKNNNCLPEIISWHELGDISLIDFEKHYNSVRSDVEKYYEKGNEPELMVNEYARHYDIGSTGGLVKWLSMFEDKDMSGCMAYWAMANSLNEMAADQNSPTSTWWVYHWYAQMTGKQCPLTSPSFSETRFYGVTSYDEKENMGYILFGGSEDENMAEVVYADNLASTNLMNNNGAVNVKIYGVGFSGQHGSNYKPELIFNNAVQTTDGTLRIAINDVDEMDAYFAVLTKPSDDVETHETDDSRISTISYEAEDATLLGNARAYNKTGWTDFATSGRADVGSINNNNSGVKFDVEVKEDGVYNASIFYSLRAPYVNPQTLKPQANGQNRGIGKSLPFGVNVDGIQLPNIVLESTVTWAYKNHVDIEIPLTAGKHTITYRHINGDESTKGNLELTAALDKLDLRKVDEKSKNNFEIDLTEMSSFKSGSGYKVTAVAPKAGYYSVTSDGEIKLTKQAVDYAKDAKTYSACSTYDIPVGNTVYLSQGANTIGVVGNATKLEFTYVNAKSTTVSADEITLHGNNPTYKANGYANSKKVISELGVGQGKAESYKHNYAYFDVTAEADGYYNLAIRYSNDEPAPVMLKSNGETYVHPYNIDLVERYAQITVNNSEPETVYFRNTMSWDSFKTVDVQVKLNKGTNRIKIYNDNSYQFSSLVNSTAPEIDEIKVSRLTDNGTTVTKVKKTSTSKHSITEKKVAETCGKAGSVSGACSECGYKYETTIPATGKHQYNSGVVTTNPTCTKAGTKTYTCTVCKATKRENLNATGHKYDAGKVTVKPTCTNVGTKTYTCTVCKGTKKETIKALGHSYDNGKVTKKPTSSKTGVLTYTCKTCKAKKTSSIAKLKGASIGKLSPAKKSFKVSWKKVSSATGYEIQYSTSSKFKGAKTVTVKNNKTTSTTVKKLKAKKKYYVRIRTYKTINGTKCTSSWSKAKTVTAKK